MKCKITAPNKAYAGEIAGVTFIKGEATTENQQAIDYCRNRGYKVEDIQDELSKLKVDELKELAKGKGIENYSNMKKEDLIEALKGGQ